MAIDRETLGAAIKSVRTSRGLTQKQVAEAAGMASSGSSLALVEQGRRSVSMNTLNEIAKALDIPPACLVILGSGTGTDTIVGKNKAASEFMESLQKLINRVVEAQAQLRDPVKIAQPKQKTVVPENPYVAATKSLTRVRKTVKLLKRNAQDGYVQVTRCANLI